MRDVSGRGTQPADSVPRVGVRGLHATSGHCGRHRESGVGGPPDRVLARGNRNGMDRPRADELHADGRIFVSATYLGERRSVSGSAPSRRGGPGIFRTHAEHIDEFLRAVRAACARASRDFRRSGPVGPGTSASERGPSRVGRTLGEHEGTLPENDPLLEEFGPHDRESPVASPPWRARFSTGEASVSDGFAAEACCPATHRSTPSSRRLPPPKRRRISSPVSTESRPEPPGRTPPTARIASPAWNAGFIQPAPRPAGPRKRVGNSSPWRLRPPGSG